MMSSMEQLLLRHLMQSLIKFLREELDLEYSEDFGIWTEKEMIPKIQEYMSSKNEVKLNEVED